MKTNLAVIALLALLVGCDGGVSGNFHVLDSGGTPISDATIEIDRGESNFIEHTDQAGNADVRETVAPGYYEVPVYVGKSGFVSCAASLPTVSKQEVAVTLRRDRSGEYMIGRGAPKPCDAVPAGWLPQP